jgi:glucokinase
MMESRFALGLDLGGTNMRAAVVAGDGRVRAARRARLGPERTPEAVADALAGQARALLAEAGLGLEELGGVGLGVAAQVRGQSGVIAVAPNLGWREVPFGALLGGRLGRPVEVLNDLDAIAWGEVQHGAARGHRDALVVFCGTGIGAGLVLGGRLHAGVLGVAGEIGHLKVRGADGAPCGCGGRGCLEAYLGGGNLSASLRAQAVSWPGLLEAAGGDPAGLHPGCVELLAEQGDGRALSLWAELGEMLGTVLANAATLLNPSAIVLGGTVMEGCPRLRAEVVRVLGERVLAVAGEKLEILEPRLGDDAGIVGAALKSLESG